MSEHDAAAGVPVWLGYDQAALDAQYDQRTLVRDIDPFEREWRQRSAEARQMRGLHADLAYGDSPRQRVDLFLPNGSGPFPLVVFFHGGGWTRHDKEKFAFPAPAFVEHGIAFACVGFDLTPSVRLEVLLAQARRGLDWLIANAARFGLDADAVFTAGHSSGAHLAACMITGDDAAPPADVKGALLVSGIYDLEPVRLSARNQYLHLDAGQAAALSPIGRIAADPCPVVVAWGGAELAEFQRQSAAFADAWERAGGDVRRVVLAQANHFTITRELADATGDVLGAFLALIEMGT
jgi:arylformamidase